MADSVSGLNTTPAAPTLSSTCAGRLARQYAGCVLFRRHHANASCAMLRPACFAIGARLCTFPEPNRPVCRRSKTYSVWDRMRAYRRAAVLPGDTCPSADPEPAANRRSDLFHPSRKRDYRLLDLAAKHIVMGLTGHKSVHIVFCLECHRIGDCGAVH